MAKKATIGAGIALDGEKEFKQAVTGINKDLTVLSSELKKTSAQFGSNANTIDALTKKSDVYNKQIKTQKTKIEELKKALKNSADTYGENDKRTKDWQISLNKAEADLAKTQTALKKTTSQINELGKKGKVNFSKIADSAEKFGKKAEAVGKKMTIFSTAVIGGLSAISVKAARAADDINTLSKQTGLTTEQIQKYQYAAERIDVPLETITGSLKKLTKNMNDTKDGTGEAKDAFEALGVSVTDNAGNLRDKQDVFDELITKLAGVENETQRDAYAMDLFGKSATDLNPLILGGADALTKYGEEAEQAGLILSQDVLDGANEASDSIDKLKATTSASITKIGAELSRLLIPIMEKVTKKVQELVKKFSSLTDAQKKTILKIGALVVAIGPALIVISKMAVGIKAVTTALAFLVANPIALAIVGLGALAVAIGVHIAKSKEETAEMKKSREEHEKLTKPIEDNIQAYKNLKQAEKEQTEKALEETEMTKALWQELQTLSDENGNVKEADKDRAEFIVGELSDAMGQEIDMIDGQIQGYKDLGTEIDKYLSKREGQILLEQGAESYTQAKTGLYEYQTGNANLKVDIVGLEKQKENLEKQISSKYDKTTENFKIIYELSQNKEYQQLLQNIANDKKLFEENSNMISKSYSEIQKYENLQTSIANSNYKEISKQVSTYNVDIKTALNATKDELQNHVTETGVTYLDLLEEYKKGNNNIKQADLNNAKEMYENAQTEYKKAGGAIPSSIAMGIDEGADDVLAAADALEARLVTWSTGLKTSMYEDLDELKTSIDNTSSATKTWKDVFAETQRQMFSLPNLNVDKPKTNTNSPIMAQASNDNSASGINFVQNNYSPKPLNAYDSYRNARQALQLAR